MTDRVHAEILARNSDAALRASRSKSDFLSRVSHELRTPLNGLLGYLQLMMMDREYGSFSAPNRRRLDTMLVAGQQLLSLINDLLDLARIEQGKFDIKLEPVDVFDVAEEVRAVLAPLADNAHVALRNLLLAGECMVTADRRALLQILSNLASNAVKYNKPAGLVTIRAVAEGAAQRVIVEDNGRGMSSAQLEALFQPFNRSGAPADVAGSGLGLVISKALAERMDGRLVIESQEGLGTSCQLFLPAALDRVDDDRHDADRAVVERAGATSSSRSILYVEDNPINVLLLQELVRSQPHWSLTIAVTGGSALALARTHAPDLALVDMHLPDVDGLQVLWMLRDAGLMPPLGCVALSADAMPEKIRLALDAGFVDYWTKPFNLKATLGKLQMLLDGPVLRGEASGR